METKAKWNWNVPAIIGSVFSFMGIVYIGISIFLFIAPADAEAVAVRTVFLPLGLVLFCVGIVFLLHAASKKRQADQLIADGRYVWATVTELREIRSINGFRGHPWVIQAQYADAYGQSYFFQSRHLYRKPDTSIVGKSVKVYIQGSNYTCYYMDPEPLLSRSRIS